MHPLPLLPGASPSAQSLFPPGLHGKPVWEQVGPGLFDFDKEEGSLPW